MVAFAFVLILFLVAGSGTASDRDLAGTTLAALTAPELAGRGAGTPDEQAAAALVASWFAEAGLEPALPDGWLQPVPWGERTTCNVLGVAPGGGALASRWIVLGAHLDHLGRVDPAAAGIPAEGEYYPGAGDNASGVAVLRLLANGLGAGVAAGSTRSVLICAFGGEEVGLVGSRYLVEHLPVPVERVDVMLNLDAVGHLGVGPLHVAGAATATGLEEAVIAAAAGLPLVFHEPLLLGSDHLGFLDAGIPALFFFTDAYPEMNSPADLPEIIDLAGLTRLAELVAALVGRLRADPETPAFIAPAIPDRPQGGNRATWSGTAPHFAGATADDGYLIGGVAESGPAARAGLRVGDVITEFGGQPVADLASFTRELRSFDPGDVVEVVARRGDRSLRFMITLGDRADR